MPAVIVEILRFSCGWEWLYATKYMFVLVIAEKLRLECSWELICLRLVTGTRTPQAGPVSGFDGPFKRYVARARPKGYKRARGLVALTMEARGSERG